MQMQKEPAFFYCSQTTALGYRVRDSNPSNTPCKSAAFPED